MSTKTFPCLFLLVLSFLFALSVPVFAQTSLAGTQVQSRIVTPIDDTVRVTVARSTHALAQSRFEVGALDDGVALKRMILVLGSTPDQEYHLRTLLDGQQTKGSSDYHHWLTPDDFKTRFGPSPEDIKQVTAWLQQQGFSVDSVARSGRWIEFSGTVGEVRAAFRTQMRQYQIAGETHVANDSDISIPSALAPVVRGVLSLHNFYSKPMHRRYQPNANVPFGNANFHAIAPADFAKIYDLAPLYTNNLNGNGQTIAIIAASNINQTSTTGIDDVATFRSVFSLPPNPPNVILNGPDPGVDTFFGIGAEATLDTEWSGAVAPNATIDVVVSGGTLTTDPIALGAAFIVNNNLAPVMSVSFGVCEGVLGPENLFWNTVWEQAAAQGISVFVASGDTGAAGCDPGGEALTGATRGAAISGFASTPFNTAVGGTEFNESVNGGLDKTFWNETPNILASVNGYIPEMVWNDSCTPAQVNTICPQLSPQNGQFLLLAGGGGRSIVYSTPSYQTLNIPGLSAAVQGGVRAMPDISLDAAVQHDSYILCFTTDPFNRDCQLSGGQITANTFQNLAGGTSFSSPEFAGLMAIVDQAMNSRQGLANYVLYPLAQAGNLSGCNSSIRGDPTKSTSCVFNDITVGNNGVPGNDITNNPTAGALGFPATTGYDLATGLGTVDANNLVNAWTSVKFQGSTTTLSQPASVTITHGQTVNFAASVANMSGTVPTPTGAISLIAQGGNLPSSVGVAFSPISGSSGTASTGSFAVNTLPGGTAYNVFANFPGDGVVAGSKSSSITATVAAENSTTTVRSLVLSLVTGVLSSGNTVSYGEINNILALDADTVGMSGLLPASGTVTFVIGSSTVQPIAIDNSGIGEYLDCIFPQNTCLPPGTYTVSATYTGDGLSYIGSTSTASISITITKGNPSVTMFATPTVVNAGQSVTLVASVQPSPLGTIAPTGTVQFMDGTTPVGNPVALTGPQASMSTTLNTGGTHSFTVKYSGDSTYNVATSSAVTVNVTAPFNFTATTQSQTIAAGGTATYNVTLNGVGGFVGAVSVTCTGAPGGSNCAVSPNPANLTASITSIPLMVTVSNTANARLTPPSFKGLPLVFAGVLAIVFAGLRRKPRQILFLVLAMALMIGLGSCGGGSNNNNNMQQRGPTNATLTVTGTSGSFTSSTSLQLTITH